MNEGNPREAEIDSEWNMIRVWLKDYQGAAVRDKMAQVRSEDRGIYVALINRVDQWLSSWWSRFSPSESEVDQNFGRTEAAVARYASFMYAMQNRRLPVRHIAMPDDLPRILAKYKEIEGCKTLGEAMEKC